MLRAYDTDSDDEDDADVPVKEVHADPSGSEISSIASPKVVTKQPGRPKGSTDQKKREDIQRLKECIHAIAADLATERTK